MDATDYRRLADQLGACTEERDHALACAHSDLTRRPHEVNGSDPYAYAARLLTAARALPERHLPDVTFAHHAWKPGDIVPAHWGETKADRFMQEWESMTTSRR